MDPFPERTDVSDVRADWLPTQGSDQEFLFIGSVAKGRGSFLDRRTLFGITTGALLSGAGTFSLMRALSAAKRDVVESAQSGGSSYTPPGWWDALPPTAKNFYLAWDQLVWNLEQHPGDLAALRAAIRTVMQTPGFDGLKRNVISFMADSQRSAYNEDLVYALIPGASGQTVHANLIGNLREQVAVSGAGAIDATTITALLTYRSLGIAPTPSIASALNTLLADLGH